YKYRSFKDNDHKRIISHQEIYLSEPSKFLCPYDMKYVVDKEYVMNELNRRMYYKEYLKLDSLYNPNIDDLIENIPITDEVINDFEKMMQEEFDERFGVFSVNENYRNQRLWKDFGDNKKGFCVGIDFLKAFSIDFGIAKRKVNYVKEEELPKLKVIDSVINPKSFYETFTNWLLTLPERYIEEQEYRISTLVNSPSDRHMIIPKESICEIILGERMSPTHQKEIIEMIEHYLPDTKIKGLKYSKGGLQDVLIK